MTQAILRATTSALALVLAAMAIAQQHDTHGEHQAMHADSELDLQLPDMGKWASDASLRQGMREIKAAFEPAHDAYRNDAFDADQAGVLADAVESQVNFMFANCQLPADADAELHKLLAAALAAARGLRESDDPHEGLHNLHRVLQAYPVHFEHAGWDD